MLNYIKNLFKKDPDPNLTALRKAFDGNYKAFEDLEQAIILLRLSGMQQADAANLLNITEAKLQQTEQKILKRLKK